MAIDYGRGGEEQGGEKDGVVFWSRKSGGNIVTPETVAKAVPEITSEPITASSEASSEEVKEARAEKAGKTEEMDKTSELDKLTREAGKKVLSALGISVY